MRGRNILQIFKAVDLLSQNNGTTINRLSQSLEIDRRNVYRLLDIIQELGLSIYDENENPGREKSWKIDHDYVLKLPNINLPYIQITLSDIMALYFLRAESRLYTGTEIEERADVAFKKLSQIVPGNYYKQIKQLKTLFAMPNKKTKDYTGKEDIIDTLTIAILQNKTCLVKYFSFSEEEYKNFRIDPLHFFESGGGLYVFVQVTRFQSIRILAVERIEHIKELDEEFQFPQDFDPDHRLMRAFDMVYDEPIEIEAWFSADIAKYIKERNFAPSQEMIENQDESLILKMETSGWFDVKKWLLSFGSNALVIRPEEMRKEIVEDLKVGLEQYEKMFYS